MAKKASSKKKKGATKVVYHSTREITVERALIDNFIGLQKVMVNLSTKFDSLSSQISKLLDLFEISAKSLAKKDISSGNMDSQKVMEKLDNISQQANLIGKGLALIHEIGTENDRSLIPIQKNTVPSSVSRPIDQTNIQPAERMTKEFEGFQKSIASKDKDQDDSYKVK